MSRFPRLSPRWICLFLVGSLIATGLVLHRWDPGEIRMAIGALGDHAPVVFVVVGVVGMSTCVPKTMLSVMAGALFGTVLGSGLMLIIAMVAAMANYGVGRYLAERWTLPRQPSDATTPPDHQDIHRFSQGDDSSAGRPPNVSLKRERWNEIILQMAAETGVMGHLVIRLSPIPTMVISYTMGACQARWWPYLLASGFAVVPQVLWVHSGTVVAIAGQPSTTTAQYLSIMIAVLGGVIVAIWIPREVIRRVGEKSCFPTVTSR